MSTLAYDAVGKGPLVILLHGAFTDRRIFGYQSVHLADVACVTAIDLPGFGGSPWNRSHSWHRSAVYGVLEITQGILTSAPVSEVLVIGWAEGASVAHEVASMLEGARLVVACAGDGHADDVSRSRAVRQLCSDYPRFARARVRSSTSTSTSVETEEWLVAMATGSSLDAQIAALGESIAGPELPVGTISISGALDRLVVDEARVRTPRHVVLPSGHTPQVEVPEHFASVIRDALTGSDTLLKE